jgi:large subunit ribosomal protein L15
MIEKLPSPKSKKKMMRLGRGMSSGKGGHTVGRGGKGQTARTGHNSPRSGFEGGQMPLSRRLPLLRGQSQKSARSSRGSFDAKVNEIIFKLSDVAAVAKDGKIDVEILLESGILRPTAKVFTFKILFDKDIDQKIDFTGIGMSKGARAAVEKAGGTVITDDAIMVDLAEVGEEEDTEDEVEAKPAKAKAAKKPAAEKPAKKPAAKKAAKAK